MNPMKKAYIYPETKSFLFVIDNVLQHFAPGSNINQPSAPARRVSVLGGIGSGAGVGSLGSVGSVR